MSSVRIFWNQLDEKSKEQARKLYEADAGVSLIQYLKARKVLYNPGCGCNVTPRKILQAAAMAIKQGKL